MRIQLEQNVHAADAAGKSISGCLLQFDVDASPSVGPATVRFVAGDHQLGAPRVWLNLDHERSHRIGFTEDVEVRAEGVWAAWSILETQRGRDALVEASAGARHAFSVECEVLESEDIEGVTHITKSRILGGALTAFPAIEGALVEDVAATKPQQEDKPMMTELEETVPMPAMPIQLSERAPRIGDIAAAMIRNDSAEVRRMVQAAAPHTLSSEVTGLIPAPVINTLLREYDASSPLYNALGAKAAPSTNLFVLPLVTTRVESAAVAAEKTDVTKQLVIQDVPIDMVMIKRAVNLSEEAIAWSGAGDILQVVAEQLADAVVSGREKYTTTLLEAVTGANAAVTIAVNGSDAWAKLAGAFTAAYKAMGSRPNLAVLTIDTWAKLAGFTNAQGAPLIGGIEQNLMGGYGTLFGVPIIVSPESTKSYLLDTKSCFSFKNADVRSSLTESTIGGRAFFIGQGIGAYFRPKAVTQLSVATS